MAVLSQSEWKGFGPTLASYHLLCLYAVAGGLFAGTIAVEVIGNLLHGFSITLSPWNLLLAALGVTLGTLVGVLPGIGPALTLALLLPLTSWFDARARCSVRGDLLRGGCTAARRLRFC
jgi:hypothetical protein